MALNLNPHQYSVDPNTQAPILTKVHPYIRLRDGGDPPMFLQSGRVHSEGGQVIPEDKWPFWLAGAIIQLSPAALDEAGFSEWVQKLNKPAAAKTQK